MFELIYTSAPKGLLPGRTGFSTVAFTAGMPPNLLTPLENLSGYEFTFKGNTLPEEYNPPVHSFIRLRYGVAVLRVASRIAPNGLDYTMRNNKIAHHILFEHDAELDRFPSGAAGLFGVPGNFAEKFEESPHELPMRHIEECAVPADLPAAMWAKYSGDAGWAGAIAERFLRNSQIPFFIEYPIGTMPEELLCLLGEVTELLPPEVRKDFTFSTYFTRERPGEDCFLRMIPEFSPLLGALKRFHPEQILSIGEARNIPAEFAASELVALAREGREVPEPPEMPEVAPPEPPIRIRFKEVRTVKPERAENAPVLNAFSDEPHVTITREYVPDAKERIAQVFRWGKWMITAAALAIFALIGIFVLNMLKSDVNWGGLKENAKFEHEMLNPDAEPKQTPVRENAPPVSPTAPAEPEVKAPETPPENVPVKAPEAKAPEAVVFEPLPENLRFSLFVDLQALAKNSGSAIDLPRELAGAEKLSVLPENPQTAAIVAKGKMRFSALPVQDDARRQALQRIRRLEFTLPGNRVCSFEVPRPGLIKSSPEGLFTFAPGNTLPEVGAFLGEERLADGKIVLTLPVKNYNESVRTFDGLLEKYFKKTGDGEPYTESQWQNALKKIFAKKSDSQTALPVDATCQALVKLFNSASFGLFDKNMHVSAARMRSTAFDALNEYFYAEEMDEIFRNIDNAVSAAAEREKAAQENRMKLNQKRSTVNSQLKALKSVLEKLPVTPAEQKQLGKELWQMLGIENFSQKDDSPLSMDFEAPKLLTAAELDTLAQRLSGMIDYQKVESGTAQ